MRDVDDVVEEFRALAVRTARHKRAFERGLAEMYEMLPDLRRAQKPDTGKPYGPSDIEKMSHDLIPRDTASRRTAPVIGTSRKKADG
jgi:hypothetical protein